jgi:hypothetical protein
VHLDDPLGDRQTETRSTLLARGRAVGLLELLENLGLIGRGNAGSSVAYRNRERPVPREGSDRDLTLVSELDGIADQVEQDWESRRPSPRPVGRSGATSALKASRFSAASGSTEETTPRTTSLRE